MDRDFVISSIDRRVFGSFVEHMGRCVYGGIYEPGGEFSDNDGFRKDVLELVKELGVTIVRYPGGNFLSGYDWRDGIGPVEQRPKRLDLAWHALETNEFGTDEFMKWCAASGIEPMMAANLGTGTMRDALELLDYCNADPVSDLAEQRVKNGSADPYGVKVWCLGNEMDGPWQLGHKSAEEYGRVAADVARGMRQMDPDVELVACGSSYRAMATFATWEQAVLEQSYELVDYISMHAYYENEGDLQSFLASSADLDAYLNEVVAVADSVKARKRTDKDLYIALDEYNVWYVSKIRSRTLPTTWEKAPPLSEDDYTVADAVVLGNLLMSILRRADRVKIACLAQLVNTIAAIQADPGQPAWRKTIFWPFSLTAKHARGEALVTRVTSPSLDTDVYGTVDQLDAMTTVDPDTGEAAVFLVNRSVDQPVDVTVDLRGFGSVEVLEHVHIADEDPLKFNTPDNTEAVVPQTSTGWSAKESTVTVSLAPASWNLVRLQVG